MEKRNIKNLKVIKISSAICMKTMRFFSDKKQKTFAIKNKIGRKEESSTSGQLTKSLSIF